ncbi:hypothetical protein Athai_05840 [Actinocatenispora thailandica]|uniref:DNRLRE domain-containing protein n=2 Tax=Actinocatenispora thailandica TaxID=227318 RepID=A0A7R7HV12_9ACTN|nr:hypothetical protein Athai_05840 [Actinocatenispora thailandica]
MRRIRTVRLLAGAAAVATAAATLLAAPATAGTFHQDLTRSSWSYTDSLAPDTSHGDPGGSVPLGAWQDDAGATHLSRVYASFDLGSLAGRHAVVAHLYAQETDATDCAERNVEVWRTADGPPNPTWHRAPREIEKIGTFGATDACPADLGVDLTSAVQAALTAGRDRLSIELREPLSAEKQLAHGRQLDAQPGLRLDVGSNAVPDTPTQLLNDEQQCAANAPYPYIGVPPSTTLGFQPTLSAVFSDADKNESTFSAEFALWPVDHPDQTTVLTGDAIEGAPTAVHIPAGTLTGGVTYAWHTRVSDDLDTSDWSTTCYLVADTQRPDKPPTVTSTYQTGAWNPGGTPMQVTFGANGVADVAAYQYSWSSPLGVVDTRDGDPFDGTGFVRADSLGGSGTVSLVPPNSGPNTLTVASYDRAYQRSDSTTYTVDVRDTSPVVAVDGTPQYGSPVTVHLAPGPNVSDVDRYTYTVNGGTEQTVVANDDGSATVTADLDSPGLNHIDVRSHSSNGWISPVKTWSVTFDTSPSVASDTWPEYATGAGVGVSGTFTVSSTLPGVVSFGYAFDWGEPSVVAATDGKATIQYTPESNGGHALEVYAILSDGTQLSSYTYYFTVADQ